MQELFSNKGLIIELMDIYVALKFFIELKGIYIEAKKFFRLNLFEKNIQRIFFTMEN